MLRALTTRSSTSLLALASPAIYLSYSAHNAADMHHAGGDTHVMTPDTWEPLTLVEKTQLTHTSNPTYRFRFQLAEAQPRQPVASCLLVRAAVGDLKDDGTREYVMRPYTPVSSPDSKHLDLVVKVYPEGKIGNALRSLNVNDVIAFKGPIVKYDAATAASKSSVSMIAGGTGITPMLQLAEELLKNLKYTKPVGLIYCSTSVDDIMMRERLEGLQKTYPNFSVHFMVDKETQGWTGGVGYVSKATVSEHLPCRAEDENALVVVCGPPPMMNALSGAKVSPQEQGEVSGLLKDMGFDTRHVFKM